MANESPINEWATLFRKKHADLLFRRLTQPLSEKFESLVPSLTWSVYWITHSLSLLEQQQQLKPIAKDVIQFVKDCAHEEGGYGGGPGQIAHLATTYASVNALITTSTEEALDSIDRDRLIKFMYRMKQTDGSFSMHDDGEIDSRATYCALAVLRCLNIQDSILTDNVADWILACQTYEGGFGSMPGTEAHGGYTFCCVASLCLLNQIHRADIPSLLRWLANKQITEQGGFNGRSNKLVDSCYSFWQGTVFPLLHPSLISFMSTETAKQKDREERPLRRSTRSTSSNSQSSHESSRDDPGVESAQLLSGWLFDCAALQDYILNQCQSAKGMLRDKPGLEPDFYHTCYALSGLSLSQHQPDGSIFDIGTKPINILAPTHPLFNLTLDSLNFCFDYFRNKRIRALGEDSDE